jgi:pimeloyl-ACP methyl ester carboxylesterase
MTRIITYFILLVVGWSLFQDQIQSKEILIKNGDIELPGSLTYTKSSKNLVIWIHGSGDVDRNGNQASANVKANYIKQLRDSLNKKNIAFFSYDKRTSNPKNKALLQGILFDDLVADAKLVIAHFKDSKQFKEITLIGHSQGSLVAMLASEGVDKYVSLAGPSERIDITIVKQITAQSPELGKAAEGYFKELTETGDIKEVNPFLMSIFAKPNLPFIRNWIQYDPVKEIGNIKIPTLIINGTKDIQVKVEDAKALKGGNAEAQMEIIDNMNHVLKTIEKDTDNMPSYFSPDYQLSKELIRTITEFIKS